MRLSPYPRPAWAEAPPGRFPALRQGFPAAGLPLPASLDACGHLFCGQAAPGGTLFQPRPGFRPVKNAIPASALGLLALGLTACSPSPSATSPATEASPGTCRAAQLALSLDSRDGWFDGMSHSGTMLVLRNTGKTACTLPARPSPTLQDAARRPLPIVARAADGTPPPVELAPAASVESGMRWVSGDVYDHGRCLSPAFVTLAVGAETVSAAFAGHLCGPGDGPVSYTLTPFQPPSARQP